MPKLRVIPSGKEIVYSPGITLAQILAGAGISILLPCGGRGICGGCRVRFLQGAPDPLPPEGRVLSEEELASGVRLACITKPQEDCSVEIQIPTPIAAKVPLPDVLPDDISGTPSWAVDLGTTTIYVCSPPGEILSLWNPQSVWGSDVISRLTASQDPEASKSMRKVILSAIRQITEGEVFISGNPVMTGIVEGRDLSSLLKPPYSTPPRGFRKRGDIVFLPEIGGFLGSDALSLASAIRMMNPPEPILALDIGTNTEMLLFAKGKVWGTSLPAGPAFEGFGISHGIPAVPGAIYKVNEDLSFETVDNREEAGICGSGLISAVYALLKKGFIDCSGRLLTGEHRFGRVKLQQKDIRAFQMAKAAVFAGAKALIQKAGINRIETVALAGNFGLSLKREWLLGLRILPEECVCDIIYLGNTSLWGARFASCSQKLRDLMEDLKEQITVIQLAEEEVFKKAYIEGMDLC